MSADSPRRAGGHRAAQVVSPQPVSDKSIIDSVAGIINDIVPQAYSTGAPSTDNRETITWARFEYADVNDPAFYPDYNEGSSIPPLLLVLGYSTGVQVWVIAASGEATEVLSWRQGTVRTLRVLPSPRRGERECEDPYSLKRPMVAICDAAGPGPQFSNVSFVSLRTGEQVKSIKFKSSVCDVHANKRSIVVTFSERIAVFDASTLDDVFTITTCYPSPGPNPNPVALGTRWLAYSEKKLIPGRRSSGGSEGEGVASYTATVLYAAKSLGKGLRGLGETVASSLTGNSVSPSNLNNVNSTDVTQPGVITVLDLQAAKEEKETDDPNIETVIAHFTAHTDAIVAMTFDLTGALLMTADKRGHDFHVFRIHPHPGGPSLAAVHHLYVLHRGDTTAKVQDMAFSSDARWAAVSTVRGTTHVFPVAPYGGAVGVRTHSSPHVVNRLSRFHRSAGISDDGTHRSHSPVSHTEQPAPVCPYTNPRLPPYPQPTIIHPLAQIRQPSSLNHANSQAQPRVQQRQRLYSDDSVTLPLKICACFAPPRAWIYAQRDSVNKLTKRAVDSLFIMACHGNLIQYDLEPKASASVPKEKVCDDTEVELEVEAKGQWPLIRSPSSLDIIPPLPSSSSLLDISMTPSNDLQLNSNESRWLSQVEMCTHSGPHRRLWMGPQFVFKTYNAPSGVAANLVEAETVEVGTAGSSRPARSNPVNMPRAGSRPLVPVVIDGSGSSYEQSPRYVESYGDALDHENIDVMGGGENQLREDLAEAMLETSSAPHPVTGRRLVVERVGHPVTKVVNPLGTVITVSADEEDASSLSSLPSGPNDRPSSPTPSCCSSSSGVQPASVCAEQGSWPAAKEPAEGQALRGHTEICAEMRPADEPAAIDCVPDSSIEELKERRSLCAEAASTAICCAGVDFDRVGAFRDVPSSPSLCAERGAVPDCSNVSAAPPAGRLRCVTLTAYRDDEDEEEEVKLDYQLIEEQLLPSAGEGPPAKTPAGGTSSDDDIEHINTEELAVAAVVTAAPPPPVEPEPPKQPSAVLSSDDDIEHVLLSDVPEPEKPSARSGRKRSKEKQRAVEPKLTPDKDVKCSKEVDKPVEISKTQEQETQQQSQPPQPQSQQQQQQSYSKKTRMRAKRQSSSSSDMVEIINMDVPTVEPPAPEPPLPSPPPLPVLPPPPPPPVEKFEDPPDMVEIIDIDALERAEKSSGCYPKSPPPDCKILMPRPELAKKKSKRHKRQPQQQQHQQSASPPQRSPQRRPLECADRTEPSFEQRERENGEEPAQPPAISSWSSIVQRRSVSVVKTEPSEALAPKPFFELESSPDDDGEANKENVDTGRRGENEASAEQENNEPAQPVVAYKLEAASKKDGIDEPAEEEIVKQLESEDSEKKSDSDPEAVGGVLVERSSSLDEDLNANAALLVVPMDTEEESSCIGCPMIRDQLAALMSEKSVGGGHGDAGGCGATLLPVTGGALPSKKASRSKKKKRR